MRPVSTATLTAQPCPQMGDGATLVTLDCGCGTTRVAWQNAPGGIELIEADIARVALAQHFSEEPDCRCITPLWRKHFDGAELGQVILARGSR
jgi:hypothetical protein